ncbi:hypothetical protein PIROE2DRAFT_5340, partial [Piromyces sp. E2]
MTHDVAINYFSTVLFPTAKSIFKNKYNLRPDDLSDRDVIRHLLPSDDNLSISLYNDNTKNTLYIYPTMKKDADNRFLNLFIKTINEEIVIQCQKRQTCKRYFASGNSGSIQFIIIKSNKEDDSGNPLTRYHFIVNIKMPDDKNYPQNEILHDKLINNIFDLNFIRETLSDNPDFSDIVKLNHLKIMLNQFTTMDSNDVNQIINHLVKNPKSKLTIKKDELEN